MTIGSTSLRRLSLWLIYLLLARQRLVAGFKLTLVQMALAVAALAERDSVYADRLVMARAHPAPYNELVRRYLTEEVPNNRPSLKSYIKAHFPGNHSKVAGSEHPTYLDDASYGPKLRRFGWDEEANRNYQDPLWLGRYFG